MCFNESKVKASKEFKLPENPMRKSPYIKLLQWAVVAVIFFFLGKMVWENWVQVKEASFAIQPFLFILSTLIFAFSYFIQVWAWYLITRKLKIAIPFGETLKSWFYSQLGKYLPGKVWLLIGRFYFYESKGKSKKVIPLALYFETVTMMLGGGLIFLFALFFFKEKEAFHIHQPFQGLILLFMVLTFVFLHPQVLEKILNWVFLRFKKEPVSLSVSYPDILWILFVCVLGWIIGGIGFYLFVDAVFPVSSKNILFLTGALAISSILGLIALFAPSGLGVREGVLVYLLSYIMPEAVAVIIAVLTRIWMTLIEIGLIGVVYLSSQVRKGLEKRDQHAKA